MMMLDADDQYSIGDTIMRRRYQESRVVFLLYATHTGTEKKNSSSVLCLCRDLSERHPMVVEIPHRVMCGRKLNTNNMQTYIKVMIHTLICL